MKTLILTLSLILFSLEVSAKSITVTVKGYGSTRDGAIQNAKVNAVELAVGSWINSSTSIKGGESSYEVNSFTTGTIESYKILKYKNGIVNLKAVVIDRSDNNLISSGANISDHDKDQLKQAMKNNVNIDKTIDNLDNINKALVFEIKEVNLNDHLTDRADKMQGQALKNQFSRRRYDEPMTFISLKGSIKVQPRWANDYKEVYKKTKRDLAIAKCGTVHYQVILTNADGELIEKTAKKALNFNYVKNGKIDFKYESTDIKLIKWLPVSMINKTDIFSVQFYCFRKDRDEDFKRKFGHL